MTPLQHEAVIDSQLSLWPLWPSSRHTTIPAIFRPRPIPPKTTAASQPPFSHIAARFPCTTGGRGAYSPATSFFTRTRFVCSDFFFNPSAAT